MRLLRPLAAAVLALAAAGCRKAVPVPKGFVHYAPDGAGFSCALPADWLAREHSSGSLITVFGPPKGDFPGSASIAVRRYVHGEFKDVQDYYRRETASALSAEPMTKETVGGREAYRFSMRSGLPSLAANGPRLTREEDLLVPVEGGFYALVFMGSEDGLKDSLPAFKTAADSFRVGS
ncbi:MAG: hypothetical protein KGL53_12255 [Elusimicrobia bacterium]|nr:hypothetical protein [Elusimicrobiota bacterium]